ncbi:hypothetical protein [cyanobacterium endosymbiont of Rhopalodia gibberula]|nr:hypothetical protein [cyanobacterium endosymbiont of Rhopalodia gibberula]
MNVEQPKTFPKTAESLKFQRDLDWLEKIDQYLYWKTISDND